jgi:hypothetical protein
MQTLNKLGIGRQPIKSTSSLNMYIGNVILLWGIPNLYLAALYKGNQDGIL